MAGQYWPASFLFVYMDLNEVGMFKHAKKSSPVSSHLNGTQAWSIKASIFLREAAGNPEQARYRLVRSGSQSQDRIWLTFHKLAV